MNYGRNAEGYPDPTASVAIKNADKDEQRFYKMLRSLQNMCELADFEILNRIVLYDKKTGKTWE